VIARVGFVGVFLCTLVARGNAQEAVRNDAPAVSQAAPSDDEIRRAIEADQSATRAADRDPEPAPAAPPALPAGPSGPSLLNPSTSIIIDGTFGYYGRHQSDFSGIGIPESGDDPSASREGFSLQEVELGFQAPVDPYFEGALFLTIPNLEGVEVEEAYLLTTALPWNLQFKAGSFRSQVGRNNGQHLHTQQFTRRPLMTPLLFGADGFRGPGAQISWLVPRLPWFATFHAEAFSIAGPEDGAVTSFGGGKRGPASLAYTGVLEQFWPVSDAVSLLLGLNFATAVASECAEPPCGAGRRDYLYGADLYFKWRRPDVVGERFALSWTTEYFARTISDGGPSEGAFYTEPVVRLAGRWYVGGRFDATGLPAGPNVPRRYGGAGSLTFAPSEFSRIRLYGQQLWGPDVASALVGFVQFEFAIGAHGAHTF
jgi:hypothetical protein